MGYRSAMRWDRLFEDLEAQAAEIARDERDALVEELRDGEWAETSWRQLLGGTVEIEARGAGRLGGAVELVNEQIVHLIGRRTDYVIATGAVLAVHAAERRADDPGRVDSALGWGHVLRALRDAGDPIAICLVDGSVRQGTIAIVGKDFVRVMTAQSRAQDVPWNAIAVVSGQS